MNNKIPVLFLVFNRPNSTQEVFNEIKKYMPSKLFIAIDGPRESIIEDKEAIEKVKKIIFDDISWDCELHTLIREKNLGCGRAVSLAINWFFENVEEGIILEDDCLPRIEFFLFCSEMLAKYRNNKNITHISGSNFQLGKFRGKADYYFSNYTHVWGWATWKRAWTHYDFEMKKYLNNQELNNNMYKYLPKNLLDAVYQQKIDTWDVQLFYTNFINNHLSIIPQTNLIKNIGFTQSATHTTSVPNYLSKMEYKILEFPLKHPHKIIVDTQADIFTAKKIFKINNSKNIILLFFSFLKKYITNEL
jgi:hypothetical protein